MGALKYATVIASLSLLLIGCAKEGSDTIAPGPGGGGGSGSPVFDGSLTGGTGVRMSIEGNEVVLVATGSLMDYADANGQTVQAPGLSTRYFTAGMYDGDAKAMAFGFITGTLFYEAPGPFPDAFEAFLAPGPRAYGPATNGSSGIQIEYRDPEGQLWSTICGSGLQTGQSFTIVESAFGSDGISTKVTVLASFSCKLYNCLSGASVTVTNGTLVLDVRLF